MGALDLPPLPSRDDVTRLLHRVRAGDPAAAGELLPLLYEQLRAIADAAMVGQKADHTLHPTALVHEAVLRLFHAPAPPLPPGSPAPPQPAAAEGSPAPADPATDDLHWRDRGHFFAVAARAMRTILVDHARARSREKELVGERVPFEELYRLYVERSQDLILLDGALQRLAEIDPQMVRVVELHFFGGFTIDETAAALGVSRRTVDRDWMAARAWLRRELS